LFALLKQTNKQTDADENINLLARTQVFVAATTASGASGVVAGRFGVVVAMATDAAALACAADDADQQQCARDEHRGQEYFQRRTVVT